LVWFNLNLFPSNPDFDERPANVPAKYASCPVLY
jgi:hypothetical protein